MNSQCGAGRKIQTKLVTYYIGEQLTTVPAQVIGEKTIELLEPTLETQGIGLISISRILLDCKVCKDLPERECDLTTRFKESIYK